MPDTKHEMRSNEVVVIPWSARTPLKEQIAFEERMAAKYPNCVKVFLMTEDADGHRPDAIPLRWGELERLGLAVFADQNDPYVSFGESIDVFRECARRREEDPASVQPAKYDAEHHDGVYDVSRRDAGPLRAAREFFLTLAEMRRAKAADEIAKRYER